VTLRVAAGAAALVALGIAHLLPATGGGLYVRLAAATVVLLLPGGFVATAVGLRLTAATLTWSLAAVGVALALVFLLTSSLALAYGVLLVVAIIGVALSATRSYPRPARVPGRVFVLAGGTVLGLLLWHVAPGDVQGDGLFHVARVRKLVELGDLHPGSLNELVGGGLHPGYAFPLWHAFLGLVAQLGGVDPSLVVQHESSVLAPLALVVAYEAGFALFRSAALGAAAALAQVALICFAPGHGGAYPSLALPATAARQLLVPAVLALVFTHVRERSRRTLLSAGVAALVLALVHPTYAIFLCLPLAGWLVARAAAQPRDVRGIAEGLAAVALPAAAVAVSLLPYVRETASHDPSAAEVERAIRHYGKQLVGDGDRYHLAPEVFARSGAVAVAALVLVPFAVLAWRRRWSAFVLGGSLAVLVPMLLPFLFMELSDAVSVSQSRRAAGFLPFAFAFAGGVAVLSRALAIFVLPLALVAGIVLQLLWPGDFGYTLEHGGPALATWIALVAGAIVLIAVVASRRSPDLQRPGTLAALAATLFVAPVAVHGFSQWSPATGDDPNRLTPGLVDALREDVPERAVVFSDLETSYRIAAAAPVLLAAAPPAHVADTTPNRPHERRRDVVAFLRSGDLAIPRRYGAGWLVVDRKRHAVRVPSRPVYSDARYSLFRL
jgi:Family of unknown function (DUF6541)